MVVLLFELDHLYFKQFNLFLESIPLIFDFTEFFEAAAEVSCLLINFKIFLTQEALFGIICFDELVLKIFDRELLVIAFSLNTQVLFL